MILRPATLFLLALLAVSCRDEVNVSHKAKYNYGYKAGHFYRTKVDLLLTSSNKLCEFPAEHDPVIGETRYFRAVLPAGTVFRVDRLVYHPFEMSGTIYSEATVIDGRLAGRALQATLLTKRGKDGRHAYPDWEVVEDITAEYLKMQGTAEP